jgi:salicylate hydroxylase
MTGSNWLIAGGGIAGLAGALALATRNIPSIVMEQAEDFLEVGAGLQLGPNAVEALQQIGAWDAVAPKCVIPPEIHIHDALGGGLLQRVVLGQAFVDKFGAPYRVIHRAELQRGLLEACRANPLITLQNGASVSSAVLTGDTVQAVLSDNRHVKTPALVVADGIRSKLRKEMFPDSQVEAPPYVIYRALPALHGLPATVNADCVNLWLYPGGHVVHYPVGHPLHLNLVAVTRGVLARSSWSTPASGEEVSHYFSRACPALKQIVALPEKWLKWPAANVVGLPQWNLGRTLLIGDAAHGTVPFLAQGAAMALEDVAVMARQLAHHSDPAAAFAATSAERLPRVARLQRESLRSGRIYHMRGVVRHARNAALRTMPEASFLHRLAWIYQGY